MGEFFKILIVALIAYYAILLLWLTRKGKTGNNEFSQSTWYDKTSVWCFSRC